MCEETETTTGYFLRNEHVVYSGDSKFFDIVIENGGKVSKNGTIANVYSNEDSAKKQALIREIQLKIDEFKSVSHSDNSTGEAYVNDIKKDALAICDGVSSNVPASSFESAQNFIISIMKYKISSGETTDYSNLIESLEKEKTKLEQQTANVTKYITSPVSGYFTYSADGIEGDLNMSSADNITAESFDSIKNMCKKASLVNNAIGKVVVGSDWRICFKSSADKFEKTNVGSIIYIRIPSLTESKIKCQVVGINKKDDDAYIVLQSNVVSGDILSQRSSEIEIIIDSYSGLRIDKSALRKIGGKDGVFVKSNGILKYRTVDVLYIGKTYAVINYDPIDKTKVQSYDEVVVKGANLYDGKVVS